MTRTSSILSWRAAVAAALLAMLCGCSQQLFGALDENAANEVVGALRSEGISADKDSAGEELWRVSVPNDEFARSVQILKRRNLPPQQFDGLGRVFKKDSLVSTPVEERARLIHAMSQELERSLMEIDGVLVARVHPVITAYDPLNPKRVNPTASVLIKYRPGADIANREAMVRSLVASGIEGLSYDDVRVLMVPAEVGPNLDTRPALSRAVPPVFWGILGVLLALLLLSYFALNWRDKAVGAVDELRGRLVRGRAAAKERGPERAGRP